MIEPDSERAFRALDEAAAELSWIALKFGVRTCSKAKRALSLVAQELKANIEQRKDIENGQ